MARVVLIMTLAVLAACAPDRARRVFLHSQTPPSLAGRFHPPEGWAWGAVAARGALGQRYGVAAPTTAPRGQVLILTATGETAEVWFETVRDLNEMGLTVWVLERAAQGGSARYARPRDLIHAASFEPDARTVTTLVQTVIKAPASQRVFVLAEGDAGVIALRAAQTGLDVEGLILTAPKLSDGDASTAWQDIAVRIGLGQMGAPGWRAWRREGAERVRIALHGDPRRARVQQAWQAANPDLRMSGPSLAWKAAERDALRTVRADVGALKVPVVMLAPAPSALAFCRRTKRCEAVPAPQARAPFWRETDGVRDAWLKVIRERTAGEAAGHAL